MTRTETITDARTLETAARIAALADEGGTIQGGDLVAEFPGRPELHCTMTVRQAWAHALPGVDADSIACALWA